MAKLKLLMLLLAVASCIGKASGQAMSEIPYRSLYNGEVNIKRLYLGPKEIGSTVWLNRTSNNLRAHYIATGSIHQRYSALNKKIILACAGAFTNGVGSPHGLTIDNGIVVNRDLSLEMDGLVIVYATGGIVVSDIKQDYLNLENGKYKLDILQSQDKTSFVEWARTNHATVFQTQLLASSKGLRLDVLKAQKEVRERRFLAIMQNGSEINHVVVDVPQAFHLGPLAQWVYDYLRAKGVVVGLLNLDTGDYNIFRVNDSSGQALDYPAGSVPLTKATNLLVYYYIK